jgi:hypothetical protein
VIYVISIIKQTETDQPCQQVDQPKQKEFFIAYKLVQHAHNKWFRDKHDSGDGRTEARDSSQKCQLQVDGWHDDDQRFVPKQHDQEQLHR